MQKLARSKSLNFRVTPEEYEMIKRRQAQTGTSREVARNPKDYASTSPCLHD